MRTDTEISKKGFRVLVDNLGDVDAEKFIRLILKEPFDYTEWQEKRNRLPFPNSFFEVKSHSKSVALF